ncbi:hypothetical protein GCM10018966_094910 [Streptomyces yanii]
MPLTLPPARPRAGGSRAPTERASSDTCEQSVGAPTPSAGLCTDPHLYDPALEALMNTDTDLLWSPSRSTAESSNVAAFMRWLSTTRGLSFSGYTELWRWSTTDVPAFWSAVWEFYGLDVPLDQVAEGYKAMDERRAIKALLKP